MKTMFSTGFRLADQFGSRGPNLGLFHPINPEIIPGLPPSPSLPMAPPAAPPAPPPVAPPAPPVPPPLMEFPVQQQYLYPVTTPVLACPVTQQGTTWIPGQGTWNLLDPRTLQVLQYEVKESPGNTINDILPPGSSILSVTDSRCAGSASLPKTAAAATPTGAPAETAIPTGVYIAGGILAVGVLALIVLK